MASSAPWRMQTEADPRRHVLFCGTEVIQARAAASGTVRAVVLQTGERLLCRLFALTPLDLSVSNSLNLLGWDQSLDSTTSICKSVCFQC